MLIILILFKVNLIIAYDFVLIFKKIYEHFLLHYKFVFCLNIQFIALKYIFISLFIYSYHNFLLSYIHIFISQFSFEKEQN